MILRKYLVQSGTGEAIYWLDNLTLRQGDSIRFKDSTAWYKIIEAYSSRKEGDCPSREILRVMGK